MRLVALRFLCDVFRHDRGFLGAQPRRAGGLVAQHADDRVAQQDRRNGLQQKQPLPCAQAADTGKRRQDPSRQRAADHARQRYGRQQQRDHLAASRRREPAGQEVKHAGNEASLGHAEQETQDIELRRRLHEGHAGTDQSPGDHDAGDPQARADLVKEYVARHFEQHIAEEEDACAETVDSVAELQVVEHLQFGEADIDAVKIGRNQAQAEQRQEVQGYFAVKDIARGIGRRNGIGMGLQGGLLWYCMYGLVVLIFFRSPPFRTASRALRMVSAKSPGRYRAVEFAVRGTSMARECAEQGMPPIIPWFQS